MAWRRVDYLIQGQSGIEVMLVWPLSHISRFRCASLVREEKIMANTIAKRKAKLPCGLAVEFVALLHRYPWQHSYEHVPVLLLCSLQWEPGLEHSLPKAQSFANILVMLEYFSEFGVSLLNVAQCWNRNGHVFSTLYVLQWSQEMVLRQEKHSVPEV